MKFRYVFKHIASDNIEKRYYTIEEIEKGKIPSFFFNEYEILSRDRYAGQNEQCVEFYEGDILESEHGLQDYYYVIEWIYSGLQTVTYKKKESTVRGISHGINQGYIEDVLDLYSIVGNIHENSDLIAEM